MATEDNIKRMKKYSINQEIPVPPPMQEPGPPGNPLEHMLSSIDHQHEFSEEDRRLTAQIETVRLLISKLEGFAASYEDTCGRFEEHADAMSSLVSHLDEQTDKLKTVVIPAVLTPKSIQELEKYVNDIVQKEKNLLAHHRNLQKQEWETCNDHLKSIIRDNKGVWLSNKVFWWALGIFELAVCLAIYFGSNALITAIR